MLELDWASRSSRNRQSMGRDCLHRRFAERWPIETDHHSERCASCVTAAAARRITSRRECSSCVAKPKRRGVDAAMDGGEVLACMLHSRIGVLCPHLGPHTTLACVMDDSHCRQVTHLPACALDAQAEVGFLAVDKEAFV